MRKAGIHNFPAIDRVVYGKAASEALNDEAVRLDAKRVFLIVSRTLNTKTDEIEKIRRALGERHVATFDGIAEHTTRKQAAEVARQAKDAGADLVVAVGEARRSISPRSSSWRWNMTSVTKRVSIHFPWARASPSPFRSPKVRQDRGAIHAERRRIQCSSARHR